MRWHEPGYWILTTPDGRVAQPHPDPDELPEKEAIAREAYFHRYEPRAGDTVVHIGAGMGWEAHLMSRLVGPTGRVLLVEAQPRTYEWLARRVEIGGLLNVTPIAVAVLDHKGTVQISDGDRHQLNRVVKNSGITVPCDTISGILADNGVDHVDLLTMNIEGAEREAIGGLGAAATVIQRVAVSCHDFLADRGGDDSTRTRADVVRALSDYGFEVTIRDQSDPRDWVRSYVYAEQSASNA